jgi:hypothetical protein
MIKMVVLSPLLDLAGFYSSQFAIADEESINITEIDGETIFRGRIDILVIQKSLWVLVIESKSSSISLHKALPQALAYMLASPNSDLNSHKTTFGLITNGSEYRFLKLNTSDISPFYSTSSLFSIFPPDDDLPTVLKILRRLAQIIAPQAKLVDCLKLKLHFRKLLPFGRMELFRFLDIFFALPPIEDFSLRRLLHKS